MEITIDTSAVVAVLLRESTRSGLIEVTRGAELLAPESLHWEIGNALSALGRRGRLGLEGIESALASYDAIPIQLVEVPLDASLALATEHGLYAYDAYMLECARRHRTPLLTLDRELERCARDMGLETLEVEP